MTLTDLIAKWGGPLTGDLPVYSDGGRNAWRAAGEDLTERVYRRAIVKLLVSKGVCTPAEIQTALQAAADDLDAMLAARFGP